MARVHAVQVAGGRIGAPNGSARSVGVLEYSRLAEAGVLEYSRLAEAGVLEHSRLAEAGVLEYSRLADGRSAHYAVVASLRRPSLLLAQYCGVQIVRRGTRVLTEGAEAGTRVLTAGRKRVLEYSGLGEEGGRARPSGSRRS